jgi:ferritin-like metal-binding protein YciE
MPSRAAGSESAALQEPSQVPARCMANRFLGLELELAMGLFTQDIKTMDDLFLHVLQDLYYTEQQIVKALPDMIEKATNRDLSAAFKTHLGETEKQVKRLEQAFETIGEKPKGTSCPAIDGIIKEANEIAGEVADKKVLDAALIAAAQAVEHYEITRYGTLIAWAEEIGKGSVVKLLTTTLNEEKAADKKLTGIAEKKVNLKAAG